MENPAAVAAPALVPRTGIRRFWLNFKRNWQLHLMLVIPFLYLLVFHYGPMYGLQIAFKDYSSKAGIEGSEWVGLQNLKKFFDLYQWPSYVMNTLALSFYSIFLGFPIPIILALLMHVYTGKILKKVCQNVSYVPHFISLVVMVGILNNILDPISGFVGYINTHFGGIIKDDLRGSPTAFRHVYVWSGIWQNTGWSTIMYVSALTAVPDELHEAAKLDGASRLRRIWSVDLPTIMPTIAIMLIMRFGSVMSVGYQKAYLMQKPMNLPVSEIISTYVYKRGIQKSELSFGSAVGLLQSIINTILVFTVNWITNLLTDNEMGLF